MGIDRILIGVNTVTFMGCLLNGIT